MARAATRGIWTNILAHMWFARSRGTLAGTHEQLAKLGNCRLEEFDDFLSEAETLGFCDMSRSVTEKSEIIMLVNRRMAREEKARNNDAIRQSRHREKVKSEASHAKVTPSSSSSSSPKKSSSLRSEDSVAPESDAPEAASEPEVASPWPEEERWLLDFLDSEQKAFNGVHLPKLRDYEFWDLLSVETNGLSKDFVERGFAEMRRWLKDNPARGPTPKGVRRFVGGWLKRNAERERLKKA